MKSEHPNVLFCDDKLPNVTHVHFGHKLVKDELMRIKKREIKKKLKNDGRKKKCRRKNSRKSRRCKQIKKKKNGKKRQRKGRKRNLN